MRSGADPGALERVGRTLDGLGDRLDATIDRLGADIAAARWNGADADRFRDEWSRSVRPGARRVAGSLRSAGADAVRQAADQVRASRGDDVTGVAPVAPVVRPVAPFPSRVRVVTLEVGGGAGVEGWFTDRVRIEDLGDGRSRVTSEVGGGAGVGVAWGDRVAASVGGRSVAFGGAVDGEVGAGLHTATAWVVPNRDVDDLLVQIAANTAEPGTTAGFRAADRFVPGLGRVADSVGLGGVWDRISYSPPPPERLELGVAGLVDLDMAADLGGSVSAGALVAAAGGATAAVVRHPSSGETSVRIGGDGAVEAILGDRAPAARGAASTTVTFDRDGRPARVEIERTVRDGDRVTTRRWTRGLDGTGTSAWWEDAAAYRVVGSGDLDVGLGSVSVAATYEDLRVTR